MPVVSVTLAHDPKPMTGSEFAKRSKALFRKWAALSPAEQEVWAGLKADIELAQWSLDHIAQAEREMAEEQASRKPVVRRQGKLL